MPAPLVPIYLLVVRAASWVTPHLYAYVMGTAGAAGAGAAGAKIMSRAVSHGRTYHHVGMSGRQILGQQAFTSNQGTTVTAVGNVGSRRATDWVIESYDQAALTKLASKLQKEALSCGSGACSRVMSGNSQYGEIVDYAALGLADDVASALRSSTPGFGQFTSVLSEFAP